MRAGVATVVAILTAFGVSGSVSAATLTSADITDPASQVFDPANNHIYQFVSTPVLWQQAVDAAAASTLGGVSGYLVTITSQAEQNFNQQHNSSPSTWMFWMGANSVQTPGVWKWVTGPEAGTIFSNGNTPVNGQYSNWDTTPNPNYYGPQPNGDGPYLVLGGATSSYYYGVQTPYKWSDGPSLSAGQGVGYIIEYSHDVSPTPLPAALPLFATGLGLVGWLSRRRKKKMAAETSAA